MEERRQRQIRFERGIGVALALLGLPILGVGIVGLVGWLALLVV